MDRRNSIKREMVNILRHNVNLVGDLHSEGSRAEHLTVHTQHTAPQLLMRYEIRLGGQ